jgi:hypothetical protein
MKKTTFFLSLFAFLMLFSCKKEDVITYEVTYSAKKPTIGTTVFSEIKYNNGTQVQTITGTTDDFSTTFAVTKGYMVDFSVAGTTTVPTGTTTTPIPFFSYQLTEIKNGTERTTLCDGATAAVKGVGNKYTLSASFSKTFDGTGCK